MTRGFTSLWQGYTTVCIEKAFENRSAFAQNAKPPLRFCFARLHGFKLPFLCVSKVFNFTPDYGYPIYAKEAAFWRGGNRQKTLCGWISRRGLIYA
jgi:hypothetical protein